MSNSEYYIKRKVSIFYGPAGGGHYTVSKALEEEFKEKGYEVELLDITEMGKPGFKNPSKSYSFAIKYLRIPHMLINYAMRVPLVAYLFNLSIWAQTKEKLMPLMKELGGVGIDRIRKTDLIINVYPQYTYILNAAKKRLGLTVPIVTIVTDISFVYALWFDKRNDLTILPTIETYQNGYRYFKDYKDRVVKLGLPIRSKFFEKENSKKTKKDQKEKENLRQVLILSGAEGMGHIEKLVSTIDKECSGIKILVSVGKEKQLKDKLLSKTYSNKIEVIEWTDKFEEYIKESEIIITKGGASSLWECLSTGNQVIVFDYIKGQENGNPEFAKYYGNGIYEPNFKKIAKLISKNSFSPKKSNIASINWTKQIVERVISLIKE
ncbi:MAG: glycosyltransferase [bacterium]